MKEDGTPEHVPDIIYFDEFDDLIDCTVSIPAEVCEACSDYLNGHWVPASFCDQAKAVMKARYH